MWQYRHTDEIYHHGIKGQRWGVRKTNSSLEKTSKRGTISPYTEFKRSSDYKTIRLNVQEYAHVMSELSTNITSEQKRHNTIHKPIGNHIYTFENNHDETYRIIGKESIADGVTELYERTKPKD